MTTLPRRWTPRTAPTCCYSALARSGVKVRILTNSLAGSDVSVVHAGYAKRRVELLQAGIQLFEMKSTAMKEAKEKFKLGRSSSTALHAKTLAVDRSRIFVGSFNFDMRSAKLNTEVPLISYEPRLVPATGKLEWIERSAGGETRHDTEPNTSWFLRSKVNVLSAFPIDWLL